MTARLCGEAQAYFDDLRKRHFPPERNYLGAHLTLFHSLPGEEIDAIDRSLLEATQSLTTMLGEVGELRFLGRGVAFAIACQPLSAVRAVLTAQWKARLTPQDRQTWRPHITVQNKVSAGTARELFQGLTAAFEPMPIRITGLGLWWYEGGPWSFARDYLFKAE